MIKICVDIKRMMLLPATLMTLTAAGQNVSGQVVDAHGKGIPYILSLIHISKALKNDITVVSMHTNMDNARGGVNFKIAEKMELHNCRFFAEKTVHPAE